MYRQQKTGFILLEILVVIAIIALLMAILVPVLEKVRDQARAVICRSNLRQWGLAARIYLDDNNQYFPDPKRMLIVRTPIHNAGYLRIGDVPNGLLWPYLKNMDILMCPQFEVLKKGYGFEDAVSSYCMNTYLGDIWTTSHECIRNEQQVYNPSRVVLFSEENPWIIPDYSIVASNTILWINNPYLSNNEWGNFATFHNAPSGRLNEGSANMVFLDGHVESLKRQYELINCFRLVWPKKDIPGAPNSSH